MPPRQTSHQRRLQQQSRNRKSRGISSNCSSKHEECSKEEEEKKQGGFAYCPTGSSVTSPDGLVKKTIILAIRALASHFWIKNCTKSKKRVRASSELWKRTKPSDCLESARVVVSRSVWCRCCLWWVGGLVGGCVSERASKQASKHRLQPWTSSRVVETVTSCRRADDISHNGIIRAAPRSNSCLIPLAILLSSHLLHFIWFSSANFALLLCTFACSADQFLILQTKKEED